MAELLFRIGRFASRRRLAVVATWLAIFAVTAGAFAVGGSAPAGEISIPGTPTARVTDRLASELPEAAGGSGMVVFSTTDGSPFTAAQKSAIADLAANAAKVEGVTNVVDPFASQAERDAKAQEIADGRAAIAKAKSDLVSGQAQLDQGRAQVVDGQAQLDKAKSDLVTGQQQLDSGRADVAANQKKIDAGMAKIAAGQAKLDASRNQLVAGQQQLNAAKARLVSGQQQLDAAKAQLVAGQQQLDAAKAQAAAGQQQLDAAVAQLNGQQAQLGAAIAQAKLDGTYDQLVAQFAAQQAQLDAGKQQLAAQQAQLDAGMATIKEKQSQIDAGMATIKEKQQALNAGKATVAANQKKLDAGKAKLVAGQKELNVGKAKLVAGQKQLNAGKATLEANEKQIDGGLATIAAKQAEIDAGRTTIDEKQAQIDAAPATIATNEKKLEEGATLLELAAGVRLVAEDGSAAVAPVMFEAQGFSIPTETKDAVKAAFLSTSIDGVTVDFSSAIAQGLPNIIGPGEMVGVVIAGIVLFVMLGTLIGAGLPILTALIGVGIGALGTLAFAGVVEMTSVTPVLGVMLGLAVGIDYALFIVNRHRRQLKDGYDVAESIALANGTSGTAVLFAGSTVIIALLALNVTGIPFLGLMGTVGAACVAIAVAIAVTLTPALLSLAGTRVLRRSEKERLVDQVGPAPVKPARPISTASAIGRVVVGVAVLALVAVPAASMRLGLPLGSADAADSTQHRAYDLMDEKFGAGSNGPLLVVADLPGSPTEDELLASQVRIASRLAAFDGVAAVAPVGSSADRTVTAFQVVPDEGPTSVSTERLVADLRAASPLDGSVTIGVAGQTSGNIDISAQLAAALPLYLALVVGLSLLIMVVVFRSLFVPIVATGGFVLSLFAALGGVVAIYQWGWFGSVFGVATPAPILNFLPTILVGVLFGLAMDYMLFLATGIREAYAHGAPAKTAVVLGVRAGRSVVVAAAIIMISVFGGFVFSDSAIIRPIGFALAFGVLVDAFLVRLLIMPGLMTLAGDWAWWLPKWLDRLIPNVDVEGASLERRHPHVHADHHDAPVGPSAAPRLDGSSASPV